MPEPVDLFLPAAFYFTVSFSGPGKGSDTSFQEVSGIGPELETEDFTEGGENRYVYRLPKPVKHPMLVLKRAVADTSSPLVQWCQAVLEGDLSNRIQPRFLIVNLLNEEAESVRSWSFAGAYPVQWEIDGFNSTKNEVAIETIKLSYLYSKRADTA